MPRIEPDGSRPLTKNNHEIFAQKRGFEGLKLWQAYEATGGQYRDANKGGQDMLRVKGMKERIGYLRQCRVNADLAKALKTRTEILEAVQENAQDAATDKQYAASNAGYKMLGSELHGMFVEKKDVEQPGRALKDGSVASIEKLVVEAATSVGMGNEIAGIISAVLRGAAKEVAFESARLVGGIEAREDQPVPAKLEAGGISHAGGDVPGEGDPGGQPTGEDVAWWGGDDVSRDGDIPGLVEGPQVPDAD